MDLQISHNAKEKIYLEYLQSIKDIKFTPREIDMVACVLHNRGEKKIAALLLIHPKTVNSHIYNIMLKLKCSARDHIIDFIESSGKLNYLHQYYNEILIENFLGQQLIKIGQQFNPKPIEYNITCCIPVSLEAELLFRKLKKHLKLANVVLFKTELDKSINLQKFEQNYYVAVLELLKDLTGKAQIDQIILDFNEQYKSIVSSWEVKDANALHSINLADSKAAVRNKLAILLATGLMVIFTLIVLKILINSSVGSNLVSSHGITSNIEEKLDFFVQNFSVDNVNKAQIQKNHDLIKQVEQVINFDNMGQIGDYLLSYKASSKQLLDYLYSLHALAGYYLFNNHDPEKSRKLLLHSISLVKSYIKVRSNIDFNLEKLSNEEVYTELSIVQDLPELYAMIMYQMGRTYIYQKDRKDAAKYFELSKYLGGKTKIFEAYLSIRSGLGIITTDQINKKLQDQEFKLAKESLLENIVTYKKLRQDNTKYRIEFKPKLAQVKTITPKDDIYNVVDCSQQIVKFYSELIRITSNVDEKMAYVKEISEQFLGTKDFDGILSLLRSIQGRKAASVYNTLGQILLEIYDQKINFSIFRKDIARALNITYEDDLEFIRQIFNLSNGLSRSGDYTKADSYNGLINVRIRELKSKRLTKSDRNLFEIEVQSLTKQRDEINKKLNRSTQQVR